MREREETLAEIPMAITAFSAEQLERGGFTGLQDLFCPCSSGSMRSISIAPA